MTGLSDMDRLRRRMRIARLKDLRERINQEITLLEGADRRQIRTQFDDPFAPPVSYAEASVIRAWARANGIATTTRGKVSRRLRELHYAHVHGTTDQPNCSTHQEGTPA